jgi:hypothetical protein
LADPIHWQNVGNEHSLDGGIIRVGKGVRVLDTEHASFEPAPDEFVVWALPDTGLRQWVRRLGRKGPKPRRLVGLAVEGPPPRRWGQRDAWGSIPWDAALAGHPARQATCVAACYRQHRSSPLTITSEKVATISKQGGFTLGIPGTPLGIRLGAKTTVEVVKSPEDPRLEFEILSSHGDSRAEFQRYVESLLDWYQTDVSYRSLASAVGEPGPALTIRFDTVPRFASVSENETTEVKVTARVRDNLLLPIGTLGESRSSTETTGRLLVYALKTTEVGSPDNYVIGPLRFLLRVNDPVRSLVSGLRRASREMRGPTGGVGTPGDTVGTHGA